MKNFIFKSTAADLQKMFQLLETIQKNVLYSTHQVDYIRKRINLLVDDKTLQDQANQYFKDKTEDEKNLDEWSKEDLD